MRNHFGVDLDTVALDIINSQRTQKALGYERLRKGFDKLRVSLDPEDQKTLKNLREEYRDNVHARKAGLQTRAVPGSSVHSNTFLSNMSVQYANDDFIGERLCSVVPVAKRSDAYAIYPQRERFEFPDDALGSRSHANEINETRSSDNYSVKDYALQNFVSQDTLDNQDLVFDEMMDLVDACNEGLANRRELRCATLFTTAANYATGNSTTLSGSDQWDSSTGGNPIKDIQTAIAACFQGHGATDLIGWCSLSVFVVLARHPVILDNLKYQRTGLARRDELASYFGLSDLLVCASRKQTANEGQTASFSRIWGLDFGVARVARRPSRRSASFAAIFRMNGDPITTQWDDPALGVDGGHYARVAVREDLKVVANPTGYIIKAAVSTAV